MGKIQVTAVDPLQEKLNQKVRLAANLLADSNRGVNEIASYDSSQKHNRQVSVKTCRLCCGVMRQKRYFSNVLRHSGLQNQPPSKTQAANG